MYLTLKRNEGEMPEPVTLNGVSKDLFFMVSPSIIPREHPMKLPLL